MSPRRGPLTDRERDVLAWNKGPEEWYAEYGGQYGAELVDAQRKVAAVAENAKARVAAAAKALRDLGIQAEAPDQSGNAAGFRDRLVLNVRGICADEFEDWVSIELRHLDPTSEWFDPENKPMPEGR